MKALTPKDQQTESRWLPWSALFCLITGWVIAVLFGGGLELHRSAVAVPLVGLGALLGLTHAIRSGQTMSLPLLIGGGSTSICVGRSPLCVLNSGKALGF